MNLIECQKKAKDEDKKFKFRIINLPNGPMLCEWLDAWYGMFIIIEPGKDSIGFTMLSTLPQPAHEYQVEIIKETKKTIKPKAREKSKIRAKKPRTTNENTPLKQFVDKFNRL